MKRLRHGPRNGSEKRGRRSGFTLLEVLVALAIFGLAAVVLAAAYINILNGYEIAARSNATDADVTFARSIVLNEADRKKLEEGGEFDNADGRHVKWSVEITSTNTADLYQVVFTCVVDQGVSLEPMTTTETFTVLRPTWTVDTGERDKLREDAKQRILEIQGKAGP